MIHSNIYWRYASSGEALLFLEDPSIIFLVTDFGSLGLNWMLGWIKINFFPSGRGGSITSIPSAENPFVLFPRVLGSPGIAFQGYQ